MNWAVPVGCGTDQFCMTKTMKMVFACLAAVAFAGGVAACDGDDETPVQTPTTVPTSYLPGPDDPPGAVDPSPSVSVSVSASPVASPSVSVSVSPPDDVEPGGEGAGDRPTH